MAANRKGITLLEIILTIILLTCGTVPIILCISRGLMIDHVVEGQSVALVLAQQGMEKIENAANSGSGPLSYGSISSLASVKTALASPFGSYSRAITITGTNPLTVTVTVYYGPKLNNTVSLVTYLTNVANYPGT